MMDACLVVSIHPLQDGVDFSSLSILFHTSFNKIWQLITINIVLHNDLMAPFDSGFLWSVWVQSVQWHYLIAEYFIPQYLCIMHPIPYTCTYIKEIKKPSTQFLFTSDWARQYFGDITELKNFRRGEGVGTWTHIPLNEADRDEQCYDSGCSTVQCSFGCVIWCNDVPKSLQGYRLLLKPGLSSASSPRVGQVGSLWRWHMGQGSSNLSNCQWQTLLLCP